MALTQPDRNGKSWHSQPPQHKPRQFRGSIDARANVAQHRNYDLPKMYYDMKQPSQELAHKKSYDVPQGYYEMSQAKQDDSPPPRAEIPEEKPAHPKETPTQAKQDKPKIVPPPPPAAKAVKPKPPTKTSKPPPQPPPPKQQPIAPKPQSKAPPPSLFRHQGPKFASNISALDF